MAQPFPFIRLWFLFCTPSFRRKAELPLPLRGIPTAYGLPLRHFDCSRTTAIFWQDQFSALAVSSIAASVFCLRSSAAVGFLLRRQPRPPQVRLCTKEAPLHVIYNKEPAQRQLRSLLPLLQYAPLQQSRSATQGVCGEERQPGTCHVHRSQHTGTDTDTAHSTDCVRHKK